MDRVLEDGEEEVYNLTLLYITVLGILDLKDIKKDATGFRYKSIILTKPRRLFSPSFTHTIYSGEMYKYIWVTLIL